MGEARVFAPSYAFWQAADGAR
jgi:hypothetical protein